MKLSNKILVGFFGFILIYLAAAFTEIRFRGVYNRLDDTMGIAEIMDTPSFSYLVVEDLDAVMVVKGSTEPRIELRTISGGQLSNLVTSTSGDTLILQKFELEERMPAQITVFVSEGTFRGMTVNESRVTVEALRQDALSISQSAGRIAMEDDIYLKTLVVQSNNEADFIYNGSALDTLSIHVNNAQAVISSTVNRVEGTLENESLVMMDNVTEIGVKKDKTSRFTTN